MRDFNTWIIEEGWWDNLGNTVRKGVDSLFPQAPPAPPTPPPPTPTPPAPVTPPAPNPGDDRKVQKIKYQKFMKLLIAGFSKYIPDINNNETMIEHIKNIAKSFVLGKHLSTRYLDELLIAIHQDQSVLPAVKNSTFYDHNRLLRYIREIYESKSSLWYDKNDQYSMHPNASIDKKDLMNLASHWPKSPNRYKEEMPKPQSNRVWSSPEVKKFAENLINKHIVKRVGGGYDRKPLNGLQLSHFANLAKIDLTNSDFNLILTKINA